MLPRYISAMLHRSWSSHSTIHAAQVRDLLSCLFITKIPNDVRTWHRTNRAGLLMSADRGGPEVAGKGSNRPFL